MHIVDSDESPVGNTNPMWKVQPIFEAVKKACRAIKRVPGFFLIDEQMIPFTGRCKIRILVKNNPRPLGLKNYILTTSDDVMLGFEIYFPGNPAIYDKQLRLL